MQFSSFFELDLLGGNDLIQSYLCFSHIKNYYKYLTRHIQSFVECWLD